MGHGPSVLRSLISIPFFSTFWLNSSYGKTIQPQSDTDFGLANSEPDILTAGKYLKWGRAECPCGMQSLHLATITTTTTTITTITKATTTVG